MKSLHLKKLAGVGEKMRTWGKSSDSDHGGHHHSSHHHHSHSQPPPHQHHPPPPLPPRETSPPPPDEFTLGSSADEGLDIDALADQPALLGSPPPSSSSSSSDVDPWEPPTSTPDSTTTTVGSSGHEEATNLLDDTPLLPELPPLPRPSTSKRRSSVPHILSRRSREAERSSPPTTAPDLLLLDINGQQQQQQGTGHGAVMASVGSATSGEKGQRLEEKIKELKLKDLALREDRNKERERRKEAEHQLKAAQKERYIQGLKVKYLETKLEKVGGNKSDMEKRVRKESQANASLQKEVDVLRSKLAERERALAERDDGLGRLKRQYTRLKNGGSDDCSLEELEELEKVLDKSRNTVVERIKQKVKEEVEDKSKCLICFDRTRGIIFVPCGHKVCCTQCSNQVKNCPICRANIEIKQKVFE
jgi:hypothetical protein